jgi:hypothetical protein
MGMDKFGVKDQGEKVKRGRGEKGKDVTNGSPSPFRLLTFSPFPLSINLFPFSPLL